MYSLKALFQSSSRSFVLEHSSNFNRTVFETACNILKFIPIAIIRSIDLSSLSKKKKILNNEKGRKGDFKETT